MVLRTSYRIGSRPFIRSQGVRYGVSLAVLACVSLGMIHVLIGALIENLPQLSADGGLSRVEKWALANSSQPSRTDTAVRGWTGEAETRQPIPVEAILETQGPLMPVGESAEADQQLTAMAAGAVSDVPKSGTFRTVCVRLCDGAYFPVSFAAAPDRFARDEAACQRGCSAQSRLFVYRNPGESPRSMVDLDGRRYSELDVAFQFKTKFDPSCSCNANPWEQEAQDRHRRYAERARLNEHHAFTVTASLSTAVHSEVPGPASGSAIDRSEELVAMTEEWDEPFSEEMAPGNSEADASASERKSELVAAKPLVAPKPATRPKLALRGRRDVRQGHRVMAAVHSPGELVRHSLLAGF